VVLPEELGSAGHLRSMKQVSESFQQVRNSFKEKINGISGFSSVKFFVKSCPPNEMKPGLISLKFLTDGSWSC
jgi:hypothetical protein